MNRNILNMKPSGIRRFTALAKATPGCSMLTIGEPDFDTPEPIRSAAAAAMAAGLTHYAPNKGTDSLRKAIAAYETARGMECTMENILVTVGATGALNTALTGLLNPGDECIIPIPAFPLYESITVAAGAVPVFLDLKKTGFQITKEALEAVISPKTKAIVLNSPNNPTGNSLCSSEIVKVIENFQGLVMLDEAYIDFSSQDSFCSLLDKYPNLVIFQTFSKAWASAGLRLGMAFASPEIIAVYNKVKYPYNVNLQTQQLMLAHLQEPQRIQAWVAELIEQRSFLQQALAALPIVQHIYPSDANFLLVKVDDADALYQYLVAQGIIVRNRNRVRLCEGCLRITVGTADENAALMAAMQQFINL